MKTKTTTTFSLISLIVFITAMSLPQAMPQGFAPTIGTPKAENALSKAGLLGVYQRSNASAERLSREGDKALKSLKDASPAQLAKGYEAALENHIAASEQREVLIDQIEDFLRPRQKIINRFLAETAATSQHMKMQVSLKNLQAKNFAISDCYKAVKEQPENIQEGLIDALDSPDLKKQIRDALKQYGETGDVQVHNNLLDSIAAAGKAGMEAEVQTKARLNDIIQGLNAETKAVHTELSELFELESMLHGLRSKNTSLGITIKYSAQGYNRILILLEQKPKSSLNLDTIGEREGI